MPNKELLDYIKAELAEGISEADIISALLAAGWGKQDVDDAIKAIHTPQTTPVAQPATVTPPTTAPHTPGSQPIASQVTPVTTPTSLVTEQVTTPVSNMPNTMPITNTDTTPTVTTIPVSTPNSKPRNNLPRILGLIVVFGLIIGVSYVAYQSFTGKPLTDVVAKLGKTVPTLVPTAMPSITTMPTTSLPSVASPSAELTFATNLETCTPYKTPFKHLLTGEMLTKEIVGIKDDKCVYVEQMPNNGKMECHYTQSERTVMAQFYKDTAGATYSASASADLASGAVKSTYTINGKTAINPLQEAFDAKICVVSGYAGLQ